MLEPLAYSIADACTVGGFGRSYCYELIAAKKLDARKQGTKTTITAESLKAYLASLPPAHIKVGQRNGAAPAPTSDGG